MWIIKSIIIFVAAFFITFITGAVFYYYLFTDIFHEPTFVRFTVFISFGVGLFTLRFFRKKSKNQLPVTTEKTTSKYLKKIIPRVRKVYILLSLVILTSLSLIVILLFFLQVNKVLDIEPYSIKFGKLDNQIKKLNDFDFKKDRYVKNSKFYEELQFKNNCRNLFGEELYKEPYEITFVDKFDPIKIFRRGHLNYGYSLEKPSFDFYYEKLSDFRSFDTHQIVTVKISPVFGITKISTEIIFNDNEPPDYFLKSKEYHKLDIQLLSKKNRLLSNLIVEDYLLYLLNEKYGIYESWFNTLNDKKHRNKTLFRVFRKDLDGRNIKIELKEGNTFDHSFATLSYEWVGTSLNKENIPKFTSFFLNNLSKNDPSIYFLKKCKKEIELFKQENEINKKNIKNQNDLKKSKKIENINKSNLDKI